MELNKEKAEAAARQLFTTLLEYELNEAESLYSIIMTLTMRLSYACRDISELELKLQNANTYFQEYARANLSQVQSAILAKEAALRSAH